MRKRARCFYEGETVNKWTLLRRYLAKKKKHQWLARCQCGAIGCVTEFTLRYGAGAGCQECIAKATSRRINGLGHDREYKRLQGMISRCHNQAAPAYKNYGARGIFVCDRWRYGESGKTGLECFKGDMGDCPDGCSIDRIDNDGPYSPENCRWATPKQQFINSRSAKAARFKGKYVGVSVGKSDAHHLA